MHVWVADCPPLQTIKAGIISQVCLRGQTSSEPCARQSLHKHHVGILELLVLRSSSTTHGRMNRSDAEAGGLHPFQKKKKESSLHKPVPHAATGSSSAQFRFHEADKTTTNFVRLEMTECTGVVSVNFEGRALELAVL